MNESPLAISFERYSFFIARAAEEAERNRNLPKGTPRTWTVWDAFRLYMHLIFTARMQGTNQVWANNEYLKNGLGIGDTYLKRAKSFLAEHKMIEYVQRRNANGTLGKRYIRVIGCGQKAEEITHDKIVSWLVNEFGGSPEVWLNSFENMVTQEIFNIQFSAYCDARAAKGEALTEDEEKELIYMEAEAEGDEVIFCGP